MKLYNNITEKNVKQDDMNQTNIDLKLVKIWAQ